MKIKQRDCPKAPFFVIVSSSSSPHLRCEGEFDTNVNLWSACSAISSAFFLGEWTHLSLIIFFSAAASLWKLSFVSMLCVAWISISNTISEFLLAFYPWHKGATKSKHSLLCEFYYIFFIFNRHLTKVKNVFTKIEHLFPLSYFSSSYFPLAL